MIQAGKHQAAQVAVQGVHKNAVDHLYVWLRGKWQTCYVLRYKMLTYASRQSAGMESACTIRRSPIHTLGHPPGQQGLGCADAQGLDHAPEQVVDLLLAVAALAALDVVGALLVHAAHCSTQRVGTVSALQENWTRVILQRPGLKRHNTTQ